MYPISVFFFLNVRCVCVCNCIIIIYYKCMNIRKNWKSSQWPIESCVVWPDFAAASLIINSNIAVRFLLGGICEQERTYTIFSSLPSLLQLQFLSLLPWFTGLLRFVRCHSQENDNHQSERILAARSHHTSPQIANIVFILSLSSITNYRPPPKYNKFNSHIPSCFANASSIYWLLACVSTKRIFVFATMLFTYLWKFSSPCLHITLHMSCVYIS